MRKTHPWKIASSFNLGQQLGTLTPKENPNLKLELELFFFSIGSYGSLDHLRTKPCFNCWQKQQKK